MNGGIIRGDDVVPKPENVQQSVPNLEITQGIETTKPIVVQQQAISAPALQNYEIGNRNQSIAAGITSFEVTGSADKQFIGTYGYISFHWEGTARAHGFLDCRLNGRRLLTFVVPTTTDALGTIIPLENLVLSPGDEFKMILTCDDGVDTTFGYSFGFTGISI